MGNIPMQPNRPMAIRPLTGNLWRLLALSLWVGAIACGDPSSSPPIDAITSDPATAVPAPPPGPPAPPADAFLALLSPEHMAELKTLGVPVVIPTNIPAGFTVTQITVDGGDARDKGYGILYQDPENRCFLVEFTAGGVGGTPTTEYRIPLNPPLFPAVGDGLSYGLNYGPFVDPDLRSQFPEPDLMSDWLEYGGGFYRLAGAAYINDTQPPTPPCQDLSPEVAVTIINSFTEVADEIVGDD